MDADGGRLHVQPIRRNVQIPDSREVGRDHCKFLSKKRNDRCPHARCLGVAVQEDNSWALTRCQIMQFDALDRRCARGDGASSGLCNPRQPGTQEKWEQDDITNQKRGLYYMSSTDDLHPTVSVL